MSTEQTEETEKQTSSIKKVLQLVISLGLGVFILWLLYRNTNFTDMWETIKDANFGILLFSLLFGLLGNTIRGIRWKLLIQPLGYNPSTSNLIFAVYGNYAINMVFPRAGEVWRCGIIAKEEKIPFIRLIGTLLVDRVFDTISVACIVLLGCFINFDFFLNYIREHQAVSQALYDLFYSKWFYISIAGVFVLFYLIFGVFKNTKPVMKVKGFFKSIGADLKIVWNMKEKKRFFIYTVSIWVCYFFYFYTTFYAFDFTRHLGITAGLIAFGLSSLSMAIPTNGGIGVWHAAVVLSLGLYGVTKGSAEAFAFGVFAIQKFWEVLYGIFGVVAVGIKKKK